jgi:hypothetical protein
MDEVLDGLAAQLKQLQRYKARFGELHYEDETERITEVK